MPPTRGDGAGVTQASAQPLLQRIRNTKPYFTFKGLLHFTLSRLTITPRSIIRISSQQLGTIPSVTYRISSCQYGDNTAGMRYTKVRHPRTQFLDCNMCRGSRQSNLLIDASSRQKVILPTRAPRFSASIQRPH